MKQRLGEIYKERRQNYIGIQRLDQKFFTTHPNSFLSSYLLYDFLYRKALSLDSAKIYYNGLLPSVRNSYYGKQIAKLIKSREAAVVGNPAASFTATDINGRLITLDQFKDKGYVLLDFWASWCVPCKLDMPFSKKLHADLQHQEVVFVYLSLDQNYNNWYRDAELIGLKEHSFLVNQNFSSILAKDLKIKTIPRYILIDKQGQMADLDAPRPSNPVLKKKIEELMKRG